MQAAIQPFAIGDVSIRQLDGLFSLNDLHRASGGESKHQPALFLRLDQTQALVSEISSSTDSQSLAIKTVLGKGKQQGTYACRELVIAYAAWISAAFHLKVIRVFLDATAPQPRPFAVLPSQTLSADQAQQLRDLYEQHAARLPKDQQAAFMVRGWSKLKTHFKVDYRHIPASQFAQALGIAARHISESEAPPPSLRDRRWLISFDHNGNEQHLALDWNDCVLKYADLPKLIESGAVIDSDLIARIGQACFARLLEKQQIATRRRPPPALAA